jgi:hypothetical protein
MAEPVSLRFDDAAMRRLLARTPDIVLEEMSRAVVEVSMLAEREVKERTPTSGAGTLRDSIGALPVTISGTRIRGGVGTALSYAAPVEDGSKPHWAPIEPLLDWVQRKLGKTGEEAEGIARAIRFKIAMHGAPAHHMFRDGFAYASPMAMEIFAAAVDRAAVRIEGGA